MRVKDKVVVVTGAGSGIGRAMREKFVAEGARQVIAVDINAENSQQTADKLGCVAMTADVSRDEDIKRIIEDTESHIGPIDLYCGNAGVGLGLSEQSPDQEWQMSWDINVMSHVYAARHLVPRMTERGGGYFLNTASAAGLLNQVGGAAYGVTKHAAVGFGEWLALTYAHQGIKVLMLCPQAVRTGMTQPVDEADNAPGANATRAASADGMMEADQVADIVVEGLARESFLILPHPEVETYMQRKTADYDRWIKGMNRLHQSLTDLN
jgi:NAD(P)-dependent dehydrogenase (short-subunit alcohol dehydrogenase family)